MMKNKTDKALEQFKEDLIKRMEQAVESNERFEWVQPWTGGSPLAVSYMESRPYRGINQVRLPKGEFITFNMVRKLQEKNPDIRIRKGEKCCARVIYFGAKEEEYEDKKTGEIKKRRKTFSRQTPVFSIDQVEGIESKFSFEEVIHNQDSVSENADKIIDNYCEKNDIKLVIFNGGSQPRFSPDNDEVLMNDRRQYKSIHEYYSTIFHELIHSTMKHFKRKLSYEMEEVVAECGANLCCNLLGIYDDRSEACDNNLAYLLGWLKRIKNSDSEMKNLMDAMDMAQKATNLIVGDFNLLEWKETL